MDEQEIGTGIGTALSALEPGEELARRRVWERVESALGSERRARRRRMWITGAVAAAVVPAMALATAALYSVRGGDEPANASRESVPAVEAVFAMLGADGGDEQAVEDFVAYLVTEARTSSR